MGSTLQIHERVVARPINRARAHRAQCSLGTLIPARERPCYCGLRTDILVVSPTMFYL